MLVGELVVHRTHVHVFVRREISFMQGFSLITSVAPIRLSYGISFLPGIHLDTTAGCAPGPFQLPLLRFPSDHVN